jgi:phospholipid transport system substrate-binding protein
MPTTPKTRTTTRRGFIRILSALVAGSALLCSGFGVIGNALAAEGDTPTAAAEKTVNAILAILRKPDFNFETDRVTITDLVKKAFDDTAMAQSVLSTEWRNATPEQQTEFKELLLQIVENTYIGRIREYTNESVEFRGEEVTDGRATVRTVVIAKTGEIPINYKMRKRSDGWFVYDVEVENVSMVSSYRDTYRSIATQQGMDGLLQQMRAKLAELKV